MYEPDKKTEPAELSVPMGLLVVYQGMEESPAHNPAAESELLLASAVFEEMVSCVCSGPGVSRVPT